MCGRFLVDAKNREIDRLLEALPPDSPPVKLGDIYPTDTTLALALENGEGMPKAMAWGFPAPGGKGVIFNARAESALTKPMFANSLRARPAAIPANGFYEWQAVAGRKRKNKYFFSSEDGKILYLAGFWNNFPRGARAPAAHFTILTTMANESISPYHSRMPVLVAAGEVGAWLRGENLHSVLARAPVELCAEKVEA